MLTVGFQACEEAHDRLRHQGLQDGVMEIVYASPSDDPRTAESRCVMRALVHGR